MVIAVKDRPAVPHCGGLQWSVPDLDALASLVALVLIGRAQHAARVLAGALPIPVPAPEAMRAQIRSELILAPGAQTYHRDGLLFEIICWLVARQCALPNDLISEPHTKATQQGVDTIKVRFDESARRLVKTTIYEYKCTEHARQQFKNGIIPAFKRYFDGVRDPQLTQATIALLDRYNLTDQEQANVYASLVNDRPIDFQAVLTVDPVHYPEDMCIALFSDYSEVTPDIADRFGDTLPLDDVRAWFGDLATRVWDNIDV